MTGLQKPRRQSSHAPCRPFLHLDRPWPSPSRPLEPGASGIYIQLTHGREAVEYAGIKKVYTANFDLLGRDPFNLEMEGSMHEWVIESLLQGAYLREYHLWEKDCRAYFIRMAERNGFKLTIKTKDQPFTGIVGNILLDFGVSMPAEVFGAIESMRERVNTMKHAAGLELDHFINEGDYWTAIAALETFWNHLTTCECVSN